MLDDPKYGIDRQYIKSGGVNDALTTAGNMNGSATSWPSFGVIQAEMAAGHPIAVDSRGRAAGDSIASSFRSFSTAIS